MQSCREYELETGSKLREGGGGGKADVRLRLAPRVQPLLGPRHVGPRSHVALASKPEPSVVQAVLLVRRSGRYAPPEAVRVVPEVRDGGVR